MKATYKTTVEEKFELSTIDMLAIAYLGDSVSDRLKRKSSLKLHGAGDIDTEAIYNEKKLLKKIKKIKERYSYFTFINMMTNSLSYNTAPLDTGVFSNKIEINDIDILQKVSYFCAIDGFYNKDFGCVHLCNGHAYATNTRIAIKHKIRYEKELEGIFIHPYQIYLASNLGGKFYLKDGELFVKYDCDFYGLDSNPPGNMAEQIEKIIDEAKNRERREITEITLFDDTGICPDYYSFMVREVSQIPFSVDKIYYDLVKLFGDPLFLGTNEDWHPRIGYFDENIEIVAACR